MDINKNKETFIHLAKTYIKRPGLEDLLQFLEDSDWYAAPASTHYHGCVPGGLVQHSINVHRKLCNLYCLEKKNAGKGNNLTEEELETLAIIGLFHDLCKGNFYVLEQKNRKNPETGAWESVPCYTVKDTMPLGHGEKSVFLLNRYIGLLPEEIYAIRWHMGFTDSTFKGGDGTVGRAFEQCPLAMLTHVADLMSTYINENEAGKTMFDIPVAQ